jgi:hypothetical protein
MVTAFDFLTLGAFIVIVLSYLTWGEQDLALLKRLLFASLALAVANQLGNSGSLLLGALLLVMGASYAAFAFRR